MRKSSPTQTVLLEGEASSAINSIFAWDAGVD